jgi:hypothetical protein
MFTDTLALGTTPVTYVRRSPRGNRSVFVPSGDTPQNERRLEMAHEVSAAKRVSSLNKVALVRPNSVTNVLEEGSIQIKLVHPASFTEAEVQLLADHGKTLLSVANVTKTYNQEQ